MIDPRTTTLDVRRSSGERVNEAAGVWVEAMAITS
jgi:hypothetical protein